mmetsp:Transcript_27732/g.35419  ORF Transcript_27732/g.35419 Transcript_27732/m.35419 type:complete len:107 (-) Transcript_27732:664-984(-)
MDEFSHVRVTATCDRICHEPYRGSDECQHMQHLRLSVCCSRAKGECLALYLHISKLDQYPKRNLPPSSLFNITILAKTLSSHISILAKIEVATAKATAQLNCDVHV